MECEPHTEPPPITTPTELIDMSSEDKVDMVREAWKSAVHVYEYRKAAVAKRREQQQENLVVQEEVVEEDATKPLFIIDRVGDLELYQRIQEFGASKRKKKKGSKKRGVKRNAPENQSPMTRVPSRFQQVKSSSNSGSNSPMSTISSPGQSNKHESNKPKSVETKENQAPVSPPTIQPPPPPRAITRFITIKYTGFHCPRCNQFFSADVDYFREFKRHFAQSHSGLKPPYRCTNCRYLTTSLPHLYRHHYLQHTTGLFRCLACNYLAHTRSIVMDHYDQAHLGLPGRGPAVNKPVAQIASFY